MFRVCRKKAGICQLILWIFTEQHLRVIVPSLKLITIGAAGERIAIKLLGRKRESSFCELSENMPTAVYMTHQRADMSHLRISSYW